MPRHLEAKKDAEVCEKPRLDDNNQNRGYPNGRTQPR